MDPFQLTPCRRPATDLIMEHRALVGQLAQEGGPFSAHLFRFIPLRDSGDIGGEGPCGA